MHITDTIDFEVGLSGEVILELDGEAEKVLRAGDTVVQNGTRHAEQAGFADVALRACKPPGCLLGPLREKGPCPLTQDLGADPG